MTSSTHYSVGRWERFLRGFLPAPTCCVRLQTCDKTWKGYVVSSLRESCWRHAAWHRWCLLRYRMDCLLHPVDMTVVLTEVNAKLHRWNEEGR